MVALAAGIHHIRPQDALLQADEPVHQLEHRARRVGRLHRPVVHGLVGVLRDFIPVFADIGQLLHVDAGGGNQGQDLARGGFDGHDGPHLVFHELLPVLLEGGVNGGDNVAPRDGLLVLGPVLVGLFLLVEGIAQVDVIAFLTPQFPFPCRLDAGHAGIVAAPVFPGMAVDIGLVHFRDVAQQVAAGVHGIVADAAHLPEKAREAVFHFVKTHVGFGRNGPEHGHGLVADGPAPPAVLLQFSFDKIRLHVQDGGQGQGVEGLHLPGIDQDVVGYLVAHQDFAVAVVDDPARGVDGFKNGGVALGVFLVAPVHDLEGENLPQQQQDGRAQAHQQADMPTVLTHLLVSGASMPAARSESRKLAKVDAPMRVRSNHSGRVEAPSAQT